MSEAELHFIRARLQGGILSKARRGELPMPLPVGLVERPGRQGRARPRPRRPAGARATCLTTFARTGSARAVVQAFHRDGLLFPAGSATGSARASWSGSPLTHWRVLRTLHNPRYAGAFVYGQRRTRKTAEGKTTTRAAAARAVDTLIPDAHPGYITFEQFERNQRTLAANAHAHGTDRAAGPAREGPALLQGLAVCGRCGRRMTVRYHHAPGMQVPDYQCVRRTSRRAGQTLSGDPGRRRRHRDQPAAARHRHPARARGRAHRPSRTRSPRRRSRPAAPQPRRARPPARRARPPPLPRRRSQTTDSSPTRSRPTGTTRSAHCKPPKTSTSDRAPPPTPRSPTSTSSSIRQLAADFPEALDRPRHPSPRTQTHRPTADRGRHPHQDRPDPPARPLPRRPDHQPHDPRSRSTPGRPARPTRTSCQSSTGYSTITPTARPPSTSTRRPPLRHEQAVHRTIICRPPPRPPPPQPPRPPARPRPAHPSTRSPNGSPSTPARSRSGTAPGCSAPTRPTTRTTTSTSRPHPATHDSENDKDSGSPTENQPHQLQEVQYETNSLS